MREFGEPIGKNRREELLEAALAVFELMPKKKPVLGEAFAMDDAQMVVLHEATVKVDEDEKLRISVTVPEARPPFEWLVEITDDLGESEYFKHYLIRENDVMLAQRKVLTPIDETEALLILADLKLARQALEEA